MRHARRCVDKTLDPVARDRAALAIGLDPDARRDIRWAIARDHPDRRSAATTVEHEAVFGDQANRQAEGLPLDAQRDFAATPLERRGNARGEGDPSVSAERVDEAHAALRCAELAARYGAPRATAREQPRAAGQAARASHRRWWCERRGGILNPLFGRDVRCWHDAPGRMRAFDRSCTARLQSRPLERSGCGPRTGVSGAVCGRWKGVMSRETGGGDVGDQRRYRTGEDVRRWHRDDLRQEHHDPDHNPSTKSETKKAERAPTRHPERMATTSGSCGSRSIGKPRSGIDAVGGRSGNS